MLPSVILVLSSALIITSSYLFLLCALIPNICYYFLHIKKNIRYIRIKVLSTSIPNNREALFQWHSIPFLLRNFRLDWMKVNAGKFPLPVIL